MRSALSLGVLAIFANLSSPPVSLSQAWAPASGLSDSQACGSSPNLYDYSPQGQLTRAYFRESDAYRRCVDANRRESMRTLREQREAQKARQKEAEAQKAPNSNQPPLSGATGSDEAAYSPPPSPTRSLPSDVVRPAPQYGGSCVAIINGVRLKMCSGRF